MIFIISQEYQNDSCNIPVAMYNYQTVILNPEIILGKVIICDFIIMASGVSMFALKTET